MITENEAKKKEKKYTLSWKPPYIYNLFIHLDKIMYLYNQTEIYKIIEYLRISFHPLLLRVHHFL